jgi:hypothetical protein
VQRSCLAVSKSKAHDTRENLQIKTADSVAERVWERPIRGDRPCCQRFKLTKFNLFQLHALSLPHGPLRAGLSP